MPTYTFQEVRRTKTVKLKCPNGHRYQRTGEAVQTVNPFNKDADGVPKSYEQIRDEVNAKIAAWAPNEYQRTCPKCGQPAEVVQPKEAKAA